MGMLPVLFAVFWTSVLAWTLLVGRLTEALRRRHPLVYDALGGVGVAAAGPGRPMGVGRELALLRFLISGRYQFLDDPALARLCGVLRTFLLAYAAFFAVAPVLLLK
jgi:hypothetical protein